MQKLVNEVYWLNNQIFSNGSQINISPNRKVKWTNPLFTPGQSVITWRSIYNYQRDKAVPQLPILKSGTHYRAFAHIKTNPANSYIIRLSFFNLQGTEIKRVEFRSNQKNFDFPTDAVSYQIDIIGAGMTSMEFERFDICEANMPNAVHSDIWVHKTVNDALSLPLNIILVKDGKQARKTYPQLEKLAAWMPIQVISIGWQYDGDFSTWFDKWLDKQQVTKFHLVSTGPELDGLVKGISQYHKNSEILLANVLDKEMINYHVWNCAPQEWQSNNICDPDWPKITKVMKDIWGQELINNV